MGKFSFPVRVQPLREETRENLEKFLLPLNRSEFICDLCGFENKVDEEKKIVVECQGCHETILGGLPNSVDHWKSFRCECNLLVSAKTFPDDEVGVKRFLGDCPKCYRVLLIDSPDIEDTRYCICPSCQQCLCYEISKNCCGGWWPLFISCRECQKSISLPQRENDSSSHSFVFAIVSFLFSCSIFCLIIAFVIGHTFMFIIAGEFFLMGFSILLILYLQFFYHKWRWGTAQEIRFESEHLPETLDILTDLSRIGKDLTLNIKRSHQYDSLPTEDDFDV